MKRELAQGRNLVVLLVLAMALVGCSIEEKMTKKGDFVPSAQSQNSKEKSTTNKTDAAVQVQGLPQGFPTEIPIYSGAKVIDADNFNGNHYTVLYAVEEDFEKVFKFYADVFGLDDSETSEGEVYYEGIDFGEIYIKGLTIEKNDNAVNVYMTLEDTSQSAQEEVTGTVGSDIVTYETAKEEALDASYPQDVVPLAPDAKVISCSMVPGIRSGFIDLILPVEAFDDAVAFYTDSLGAEPKTSATAVQQAAQFKGEKDGIKFVVLISHLNAQGNDTLIQITVDEK